MIAKEFKNQVLLGEDIVKREYQPEKGQNKYRVVIAVSTGEAPK